MWLSLLSDVENKTSANHIKGLRTLKYCCEKIRRKIRDNIELYKHYECELVKIDLGTLKVFKGFAKTLVDVELKIKLVEQSQIENIPTVDPSFTFKIFYFSLRIPCCCLRTLKCKTD